MREYMDVGYGMDDSDIDAILAGIDDYVPTNRFRRGETCDVFVGEAGGDGMDFDENAGLSFDTMESALNGIEKAEYRREVADWDEDEDDIESAAALLGNGSYGYSRFIDKGTRAAEVAKSDAKGAERGCYIGPSRSHERRGIFDIALAAGDRRAGRDAASRQVAEPMRGTGLTL